MRNILYYIILNLTISTSCGETNFDNKESNEDKIKENVLAYLAQNKNNLEVKNFLLIHENISKQFSCPLPLKRLINIVDEDVLITLWFDDKKANMFLDKDDEKGILNMSGIKFSINGSNIRLKGSMYGFNYFIEERMDHIDLKKLINHEKLIKLNQFFEKEMKPKQIRCSSQSEI